MIRFRDVRFRYAASSFELAVSALEIPPRQRVAIIGPSGSGKTTLLHLMAGIQVPHTGEVNMNDHAIHSMTDSQRRRFRAEHVGLIFQEFELLDYLNTFENILLPYRLHPGLSLTSQVRQRADELARTLGLADKLRRRSRELSQGERQRVAIARALVTQPQFVLADEPTGNLDPTLKTQVLDLFLDTLDHRPATLVMVTHDHSLLDRFHRVLSIDQLTQPISSATS